MLLTYVVYAPSSSTACKNGGFDDSKGYFTKVIYSKDLEAEKTKAIAQLKSQYGSSATLAYASTYLTNLKYAAVIRYTKKFTGWNCEVPRIMIGFGTSASDALSKAISKKNSDTGSSTPHTVLKQLHW